MPPKTISFVRGFRLPTPTVIDGALGTDTLFSREFQSSFDSLPHPTSELDWLANYREKGQTYDQFLRQCPYLEDESSSRKYIYLTLLDNDDRLSLLNIDHLIDYTERFFQMKVKLLPLFRKMLWNDTKRKWTCTIKSRNDLTKETHLVTRYHPKSTHSQICVTNILKLLKRSVPSDARCLVAITLHDFYSEESDLFIAGLAEGNSRVAAFSFFRYDPRLQFGEEFWHDWKMKKSKSAAMSSVILLRSCRLLTHEIGHLLGLDHCIYYGCLMNGSGHLEEDFSQPLFLCPIDLRKLSQLTHVDFSKRYERLLEFCTNKQFEDESNLLRKRLAILEKDKQKSSTKKRSNTDNEDKTKRLKKE